MDIDRRQLLGYAGLAGAAMGTQALFPSLSLAAGPGNLRIMKASLGSKILSPAVSFFWLGMHEKLNYFLEEGIIAQWRGVQNQTQAMSLITAKRQALGGVGPSTLMGLAARGTKVPLKVAYAHYQRNPYRGCVLASSPAKGWADLAGKKVGLINLGQLSTKWYAEAAVREAGADPASLKFLPAGVHGPAGANLKNGAVDAYVSHNSHVLKLRQLGFDIRILPEPDFGGYRSFDGGMTVHEDMLNDKDGRKALTGFFRAVAKGAVFSVENPEAATRIHFDLFPASIPKGKDFETAVKETTHDYKQNLALTIPHGDPHYFGLQTKERWETVAYTEMQLTKKQIPDVGAFYSTDVIAEANDFDHDAVRQQARNFTV